MDNITLPGAFVRGSVVAARKLTGLYGETVSIPDEQRIVHLQFRRFAGCPVCSLHLRSFVSRYAELAGAGIREIVVFHSRADELKGHAGGLPFTVIADPDKRLYREFGVSSSLRALLDPRVWFSIVMGVSFALLAILRGRARSPDLRPHGGRWGLPGDFLIAPDGRLIAAKYGQHAADHWSVDEVLELSTTAGPITALTE